MNIFVYDKSFDGLLTAVFEAYFRKTFPSVSYTHLRANET